MPSSDRCECGSETFKLYESRDWNGDEPSVVAFCAECGAAVGRFVCVKEKPEGVLQT